MKHKLSTALGLVVLAVALGASPVSAQTVAPGPYYANPSWDQKLQCDTQASCPRFIVLSNWSSAAVLDRETGLVWERSPSTLTLNWFNAQLQCNTLYAGGRSGWRLPTIQELMSLVDRSVPLSFFQLPSGNPFTNVHSSVYWSATTNASSTSNAWGADFLNGGLNNGGKSGSNFVWCVRGGA